MGFTGYAAKRVRDNGLPTRGFHPRRYRRKYVPEDVLVPLPKNYVPRQDPPLGDFVIYYSGNPIP